MHVCYIQFGYPLPGIGGGGAGTYVRTMARELLECGHRVSVITRKRGYKEEILPEDGYKVYCIDYGNAGYYIGKIPGIGKLVGRMAHMLECDRELKKTLLTINREEPIDLIEVAENWFRSPLKVPIVVHLHGSAYTFKLKCREPITRADVLQRKLELGVIRRASQVFAPARHLVEEVRQEGGIRVSSPYIEPYPLHLPPPSEMEEQDSSKNDSPMILFVGRIEERKGAHLIIQAIPAVLRRYPDARFVFAGTMSAELAPASEELTAGGGQSVCFLPFQPHDQLLKLFRQATISLVPSIWDNAPYTVIEAFSRQTVVIGTRVGGIAELLSEGRGLLVDPENPEMLAEQICRALGDKELRADLIARSTEFVHNKVEAKANCQRRIWEYQRLIAPSPDS